MMLMATALNWLLERPSNRARSRF